MGFFVVWVNEGDYMENDNRIFYPKVLTCFKDYSKDQLMHDFMAGLMVAVIALPLSIALAIASGLGPEKGLVSAIVGGLLISIFSGSRVQIGGPSGAFVVLSAGILLTHGIVGLSVTLLMAGIMLILLGMFKMGNWIKFIPFPVTAGYTNSIAIIILFTQIGNILGLNIEKVPSDFLSMAKVYGLNITSLDVKVMMITVLTLGLLIIMQKISKKIPASLVALTVATLVTHLLKLEIPTLYSTYGAITFRLPTIALPLLDFTYVSELFIPAFALAILIAIESLMSAVVSDGMINSSHRSNTELVAQGIANIACSFVSGLPVTGALARTAANVKSNGRTPISGIVHAIVLLIFYLFLMPIIQYIPLAALGAILVMVSYNMMSWESFKELPNAPKGDAMVFILTFSIALMLDLIVAIQVGMILSMFIFMRRMSDMTNFTYKKSHEIISEDKYDYEDPYLITKDIDIYEIKGAFFFAAADVFMSTIKRVEKPPRILILKMDQVPIIDASGYYSLKKLFLKAEHLEIKILVSGMQVETYRVLKKFGLVAKIGEENFYPDLDSAIQKALSM